MKTVTSIIFYSSVYSVLLLVAVTPVRSRGEPPSLMDLIQLYYTLKNNYSPLGGRLFKRIHNMPLFQFIKTVNDIVEPVVTAAEVVFLIKKLKDGDGDREGDSRKPPIHLTTNDHIIVFSGNNKLQVNHMKKPMDLHSASDEGQNMIPEQSMLNEQTTLTNTDDLLHMESSTYGSAEPMLLSSKVRHSPKGDDNYFQFDFVSNENQDFNLVRDLPKNFVLTHRFVWTSLVIAILIYLCYFLRNPIKVTKKTKHRKRRRKQRN